MLDRLKRRQLALENQMAQRRFHRYFTQQSRILENPKIFFVRPGRSERLLELVISDPEVDGGLQVVPISVVFERSWLAD